jgi:DNA-binding transcriptional LysR family regulator
MINSPATLVNRMVAKLRLRQMQLIVLTAELGNTHKVAAEAGISQPSVVKFLGDVESLLDINLFERHARGMRPTAACHTLLPTLRSMLRLIQATASSVVDLQTGTAGVIHIGALPAACQGPIMSVLARFAESHPHISTHLHEDETAALMEDLSAGTLDVLFTRQSHPYPEGYAFIPLLADRAAVVARSGHRLASEKQLTVDALAREKWLTFPASMTSRTVFESWFARAGRQPERLNVTTSSLSAIVTIVAESDALVVLPYSLVAPSVASGRFCLLDTEKIEPLRPLGILWRSDTPSLAVRILCEWMSREIESTAGPAAG